MRRESHTFVDVPHVRGVSLFSDLLSLLLLAISRGSRLKGFLRDFRAVGGFGWSLGGGGSWGFASSRSGFGGHWRKLVVVGGG
jgi:hypothetical protein